MPKAASILIIDPDPSSTEFFRKTFRDQDFRFTATNELEEAVLALQHRRFEAVIYEMGVDKKGGLALIGELRKSQAQTPVIACAAEYDSRTAIEVVKAGAFDFLAKPFEQSEVIRALGDAIQCARKMGDAVAIDPLNKRRDPSDALVGNSRSMLQVYKSLGRLSPTPVTVLIRGETGTGKELVARALYQHGHRAHLPFITVNCAAIPESLLESELFGHERGAFTGASHTRIGKFEQANNATLFLDEIGDLDLALQSKLLRALQEKRLQRVGGSEEIQVDVRIIAATHQPLEQMISEGRFREDLFYRLNVASIELPPLRFREGDVPLLTHFFIQKTAEEMQLTPPSIGPDAIDALESQSWPGNVRQLQNVIRKCILASRGYGIDRAVVEHAISESIGVEMPLPHAEDIEGAVLQWSRKTLQLVKNGERKEAHRLLLSKVEPILLEEAMRMSQDNLSQAAKWLGLSRLTLRERLRQYELRL